MSSIKRLVPLNAVPLDSDPASGRLGDIYYNSVDQELKFFDGSVWQAVESGTATVGITKAIYQDIRNQSGTNLDKATPVYVSGSNGASGRLLVTRASYSNEMSSSKTVGLLAALVENNNNGTVITEGILENIDTTGAIDGDPVWLGQDGQKIYGYINKPHAPNHLVFLGIVIRGGQQNTGSMYVKIQNGFELDELHDVLIVDKQDNQVLRYDSASSLWKNETIDNLFDPFGAAASAISTSQAYTDQSISNFSGTLNERIQDQSAVLFDHNTHTGISVAYDDANNKIILSSQANPLTIQQVNDSGVIESYQNISTLQFDENSGFDVINPATGTAKITMNSTFKFWEVDGNPGLVAEGLDTVNLISGTGIDIVASSLLGEKSIRIDVDTTQIATVSSVTNTLSSANTYTDNRIAQIQEPTIAQISATPPSSPTTGDLWLESDTALMFAYDGSFWVDTSSSSSSSGGGVSELSALTDVDITNTQDGEVLVYDEISSKWVNSNTIATKSYADNAAATAAAALVDSAPGALNTLNELAAAINDDASYAASITTVIGNKQDKVFGVSDTEIGYLSNVNSDIQNQIDNANSTANFGYSYAYDIKNALENNQSNGYVLTANGSGVYSWQASSSLLIASVSSNINLSSSTRYFVDTSAARTLTLPASPALGAEIQIFDSSGTASTYNITVARNGNKINGGTGNLIIDMNGAWVTLVYTGSTYGWKVA